MIVLPRKSTSVTPKWLYFSMVNLSPAFLMHSSTARKLCISCVTVLAANSMSSTYCAPWSALITLIKHSRMKLENTTDRALLRPCSSLLEANVLLAKFEANNSIDLWSAFASSGRLKNNLACRKTVTC